MKDLEAGQRRGGDTRPELIERMLSLQPRVQRALDPALPPEILARLGSVTYHQLEALACLPEGGTTMRRFADAVGVTGAAATALANRMVKRGLAVRRHDSNDRRRVWLAPTATALEMVRTLREWQRQSMAETLTRLSADQVETFLEVLGVLEAEDEAK